MKLSNKSDLRERLRRAKHGRGNVMSIRKRKWTTAKGEKKEIRVKSRIDTAIEVDYYKHGGILPYVLRELIGRAGPAKKAKVA